MDVPYFILKAHVINCSWGSYRLKETLKRGK